MTHARTRITNILEQLGKHFDDAERALNQLDNPVLAYYASKLVIPIVLCGVAALAITALWQLPYVLCGVLVAIAFIKHKLFPIRLELFWFLGVAALGAYAESLIITTGGAWSYTDTQFAHIPVWLPAIWGLVGISLMTAYAAVTEKRPVTQATD